ncbi:MAG TPA: hypothetical protein VK922_14565 [Gemmatimonadaceae bacterium]|nr:hypothetical protein [Gemmatimonadaceae bacterium]
MKRIALLAAGVFVLAGCPGDDDEPPVDTASPMAMDTTPVDFDSLDTNLPPPVPDTQPARPAPRQAVRPSPIPPAPPPLMEAVSREQSFTQFCYQEFGQKADPTLRGGVAVVVTVGADGITDARVENDSWTSSAGAAVNRCLNERAKDAWRLGRGAVRPGKYVVNLTFTPA